MSALGPSQKELFQWQGIIKDAPESHVQKRARKKFDQLDVDLSGYLDGKEVDHLAEWVWSSFNPGKMIDSMTLHSEAVRLWHRCDKNGDGKIDRHEFGEYYEQVVACLCTFLCTYVYIFYAHIYAHIYRHVYIHPYTGRRKDDHVSQEERPSPCIASTGGVAVGGATGRWLGGSETRDR